MNKIRISTPVRSVLLLLCLAIGGFSPLSAQKTSTPLNNTGTPEKKNPAFTMPYKLPDPIPFGQTITAEDMKLLLDSLASATMAGRETGEEGQRLAADFIAAQFKAAGLPATGDRRSYFQQIYLEKTDWEDLSFVANGETLKNREDFFVMPAQNADRPEIKVKELVFVGYGIKEGAYDDYADVDVNGKSVIFYSGEAIDASGKSRLTGSTNRSNWSVDWPRKIELAKQKGATLAIIVDNRYNEDRKLYRKLISTAGWKTVGSDSAALELGSINSIFVSPESAATIFGKKAEKIAETMTAINNGQKSKAVKFKADLDIHLDKSVTKLEGSNVLGVIEGTDPELKKEFVFITAHYDHLGKVDDVIYHGADDNASGTSGVIEIARAFAEAKKKGVGPKRTVVCMLVSGEEKGLLGSRFYTDFPVFSLKNTVVDINIDMIGRVDKAHEGKPDYIYVIGADRLSNELHEINERANLKYTNLALDYKYNEPNDPNHFYERSDHFNFTQKGIPAIFYFNGTHADYHRPSDTADKIDFNAAAKRAQLAFYTAWDIANRPTRLRVDKMKEKAATEEEK